MSTVYKGQHELTGRIVAIKVLRQEFSMDEASTKRFQREVKAISTLSHPYLIAVHDVGTTPAGQPYQVIEYLQGEALAGLIEEHGRLDPKRAVRIVSQICDAMEHAHSKGVIHRDLKPENIMLVNYGGKPDFVKVVDFGIVKLTQESQVLSQRLTTTGEVWGSPLYASPEQCMGRELDKRSDVYSVGLILYETLTGKPAVSGKSIGQIAMKHVREKPAVFDVACPGHAVPTKLEAIAFKALEKEPAQRFQTMAEMRNALEQVFPGISAGSTGQSVSTTGQTTLQSDRQIPAGVPPGVGTPSATARAPGTANLDDVNTIRDQTRERAIVDGSESRTRPVDQPVTVDQVDRYRHQSTAQPSGGAARRPGRPVSQGAAKPSMQVILIVAVVVLALALIAVLMIALTRR